MLTLLCLLCRVVADDADSVVWDDAPCTIAIASDDMHSGIVCAIMRVARAMRVMRDESDER